MLCTAAQVARIDLKVDLAVTKTMQIYKRILKSASGVSVVPLGNISYRVTVAVFVCKAVVNAFGVPSVTAATIQQIVKNVIWDDMGRNFSVFVADCIATVGVFGTLVLFGMPVSLAAGAVTIHIIIPATVDFLLILSRDVNLILIRAFKDCAQQCLGQPLKQDIEKAALAYRQFAKEVHQEIKDMDFKFSIIKVFRFAKIQFGVEKMLKMYTKLFIEQSEIGASCRGSDQGSEYSRVSFIGFEKASNAGSKA